MINEPHDNIRIYMDMRMYEDTRMYEDMRMYEDTRMYEDAGYILNTFKPYQNLYNSM